MRTSVPAPPAAFSIATSTSSVPELVALPAVRLTVTRGGRAE
jgi:hypothetical protein